jgi:adenylyltransferase/sulfurtransferase
VLSIDFWNNKIRQVTLDPSVAENCKACVRREFEFLRGDALPGGDAALCGRDAVQISPAGHDVQIDLKAMARRWESIGPVQSTRFFVRLHIDQSTHLTLFRDGRAVVQGIDEVSRARSLFDRFVGG